MYHDDKNPELSMSGCTLHYYRGHMHFSRLCKLHELLILIYAVFFKFYIISAENGVEMLDVVESFKQKLIFRGRRGPSVSMLLCLDHKEVG